MAKIDYNKLEKQLRYKRKNSWEVWDDKTKKDAFSLAENYKRYLNSAKTARESINVCVKAARVNGFANIGSCKSLKAGDLAYFVQRDKSMAMVRIGKKGLKNGFKLLIAHVDSPHLDFKVTPLFEEENLAFIKTHYYGGIKKYQWPTIALALHGVVYLTNGKTVEINIGEKETDPVFMITDLLPHLDRAGGPGTLARQREIQGEELNLVVGSIPVKDEKVKEKVKLAVLEILYQIYGISEEDLSSADIEVVPSEKARDLGFDRSLISAYGHDDRSCVYTSIEAFFKAKNTDQTQICILVDREEIGSEGNTSARSIFIEVFISDILKLLKEKSGLDEVFRIFSKSRGISADVTAAVDPDYKDVHDLRNAARLGYGIVMEKHTGSGGKYSTSEASGDYISDLRRIFAKNKNITYQFMGGIGKIDLGGGGTIAKYLANRNMEIIDMGIPLFNMHAPLEIASKADIYSAFLAYKEFLEN
jgi:aspartyl aminopeptidase